MTIVKTYQTIDSFTKLRQAFAQELAEVEVILVELVKEQPGWFQDVIKHLVLSGGKRIRPLLTCLSYALLNKNQHFNQKVLVMAALAELVHTATLFHDDIIDDGEERRGKPTANKVYGNHTAVLAGDFILGKVFKEINKLGYPAVLSAMIDTVDRLIEGEIWQMELKKRHQVNFADYDRLIYLKTASLFEWCMVAGAHAAQAQADEIIALQKMGYHIGRIFQIVDDILDYTGNNLLGKKRLQDFHQGKITLPLLFLFSRDSNYFKDWKEAVNSKNVISLEHLSKDFIKRIKKEDIQTEMKNYLNTDIQKIRNIIAQLPYSSYHEHINNLIDFLVSRMK